MISVAELGHTYRSPLRRRPRRALSELSLEISAGSSVAVLGLNGAGKTTFLRVLLGYLRPSTGSARIGGLVPRAYVERHGIAYVPERVAIPGRWSVAEALTAYALLGNVGADLRDRVDGALHRLGLGDIATVRVAELSKGNLQRLALAQAILCEREIMVLDEPSDGLDPLWISELRSILQEWRARDPARIVVIASHDLPLVERVAERALVLHEGGCLADLELGPEQAGDSLEATFLRLVRGEKSAA